MKNTEINNYLALLQQLVRSNKELMAELDRNLTAGQILNLPQEDLQSLQKPLVYLKNLTLLANELEGHVKEIGCKTCN